jgi:two-component system chemotaxis response regulator CheB
MTDLQEKRVLVVEDDYFLAQDISEEISRVGATVIGPAPSLERAFALSRDQPIDVAILDINLGGEMVFPVADALAGRGTALLFITGYDTALIPRRFAQYAAWEKPAASLHLARELPSAIRPPWLVALGASGPAGISDLRRLLRVLSGDLNAVVMVVLHRPWELESHLSEVLQRASRLPIVIARDLMPMASGRVYLGEPSQHLRLGWRSCAELVEDPDRGYSNRTVDLLFDSLAERGAGRTIGVILSGSLDDGASGLCAIKASGGLVMTVLPSPQADMARSAAARLEIVDFVGRPEEIAFEIERIVRAHPYASLRSDLESVVDFRPR